MLHDSYSGNVFNVCLHRIFGGMISEAFVPCGSHHTCISWIGWSVSTIRFDD